MKSHSSEDRSPEVICVLRRPDQAGVAAMVAVALVAMGLWAGWRAGFGGRVVEFDRAEPAYVEFEIDLNRAEWPELAQLPGIGETLARRIVESRESNGPFLNHDELRRVRGIGAKKLDAVRPYLRPMAGMGVDVK
jgi:competence protein ComEA